jgi:hypothetical protein
VRKIISILLALGMILALSAMAAPVAAAPPVCPAGCTLNLTGTFCAGGTSTYLVGNITLPVTLTQGTDSLSVEFPAGTDLTKVVYTGVLVNAFPLGAKADLTGNTAGSTRLEFVIPVAAGQLLKATVITIQVNGVINTATAGKQCLYVDYKLACCAPVVFGCVQYTVAPAISTLGFHFDFDKTYTGIAEDFIPPFKACGQNASDNITTVYNSTVGWMDVFDVILRADVVGCAAPCANATMWFALTKVPAGETVTFHWDTLNATATKYYTLTAANVSQNITLPNVTTMPPADVSWEARLHFSSPGDYEICFYLQCAAVPCLAGAQIVATKCLPVKVYQWKDAFKLHLYPKWNLISLPLYPFDTKIASVFASMDKGQLVSVWYFGQCENPAPGVWHTEVYNATSGIFTPNTTAIEAGKAYWVRMLEPGETGYNATAFSVQLWVFGTHAPMPPATSMGYFNVCEGWNMVGFKAPWVAGLPTTQPNNQYLWNFNQILGGVHYGLIYDWVEGIPGDWTTIAPGLAVLTPGVGYWIPFDGDGEIYPAP